MQHYYDRRIKSGLPIGYIRIKIVCEQLSINIEMHINTDVKENLHVGMQLLENEAASPNA